MLHFRYKLLSQAKGFENQLIFLYSGQAVIFVKVPCNLKVRMFRLKLTLPALRSKITISSLPHTYVSSQQNLYWCRQKLLYCKVDSCLSFKGLWLKLLIYSTPIISFSLSANVLWSSIDLAAFSHSIILHMFTGFILHSPCLMLVSLSSAVPSLSYQLSAVGCNSCYNEYSILSVLSSVNMWSWAYVSSDWIALICLYLPLLIFHLIILLTFQ